MRRFAASILDRRHASAGLAQRLRDTLPRPLAGDSTALRCDPLTGLGQQSDFVSALERGAARDGRGSPLLSLVLIDVDHLGVVNTRDGHVNGDALLRRTAEAMRRHATGERDLFRIGGDEFAMLLPGIEAEEARGRALAVLGAMLHPLDEAQPGSISAGVAGIPWSTRDPELMYRQAAAAMADVKRRGRASVAVFDPRVHVLPRPVSTPAGDLVEQVVTKRTLRPVFQPIIDLRNGQVLGFEGLVRLPPSEHATGARELFEAADASGRVAQLDIACMETVIAGARAMRPDHVLTLNLSPRTLSGRDFDPAWLLQSLVRAGISPSRVVVELSDDKPVDDIGRLHRSVVELQRLGLRLAADDVSIDDPTHRLLTHLPFDIVKIDLAQVWEGAQTGPFLALLRDAALGRRARVVAEGVETSEQLVAVRDLEFGAGQGFLLGRPDASVAKTHVDVFELENGAFEPPLAEVLVASPAAEHDGIDEIDLISEERRALFMPPARTTFGREPGPA
jgi:diguanylate cyclase (GGDEF)-like protein